MLKAQRLNCHSDDPKRNGDTKEGINSPEISIIMHMNLNLW